MRIAIALFVLCGCNQLLGVEDPVLGDDGDDIIDPDAGNDLLPPCTDELPFIPGDGESVAVNGRIFDVETDAPLTAASPNRRACTAGGATDGPCELRVRFYDTDRYEANPGAAQELGGEDVLLDDCGRFHASRIFGASAGVVVVVDAEDGTVLPAASEYPATAGGVYLRLWQFRPSTADSWTTAASLPDPPFGTRAAMLVNFLQDGAGLAGVTVVVDGNVWQNEDYYFTSADRSAISRTGPTGPGGSAILVEGGVGNTVTGGGPASCQWPSVPLRFATGVLWVLDVTPSAC